MTSKDTIQNHPTTGDIIATSARGERDTYALMGLAALLITNSHLEPLYPIAWMAADGLLGNLMFFFLAGYGVSVGQRIRPYGFGRFYFRRLSRIFPSLWLVVSIGWFSGWLAFPGWSRDLFSILVWPTDYHFIAQILIFYPVAWWLARLSPLANLLVFVAAIGAWLVCLLIAVASAGAENRSLGSLPSSFWWSFFFVGFLAGAWRGSIGQVRGMGLGWLTLGGAAAACYLALKFGYYRHWFDQFGVVPEVVAALLQAFALVMVFGMMNGLRAINSLLSHLHLRSAAELIGRSSLQIYLSHIWYIAFVSLFHIPWPVKLLLYYPMVLATSSGIRWIVDWSSASVGRLITVQSRRNSV